MTGASRFLIGLATPAHALQEGLGTQNMATPPAAANELTTPTSVALGGAAPGRTISAQLGTVKVDDTRLLLANWTATASAVNFVTGGGSTAETITSESRTGP